MVNGSSFICHPISSMLSVCAPANAQQEAEMKQQEALKESSNARSRLWTANPKTVSEAFGLADGGKFATSAAADPTGQWIVITDNFGRITLLASDTLEILRVLKGYRDAQCCWMLVHDATTAAGGVGYGMYLVILAPSRAQVEVWRAPMGPRVMVMPVEAPSRARLISTCSAGVVQGADSTLTSDCSLLLSSAAGGGLLPLNARRHLQ
jgi:Rab3 GTPase-activating protein regulatory subunit N-terminus